MMTSSDATAGRGGGSEGVREDGDRESADVRLRRLEKQVETLVLAVRALAEGLECPPAQGAGDGRAARGARLAHELLLSRGL